MCVWSYVYCVYDVYTLGVCSVCYMWTCVLCGCVHVVCGVWTCVVLCVWCVGVCVWLCV